MPPCCRQVEIDMLMQLDGLPEKVHSGVLGDNSAATARWRWTCSHVADAAPEWPALLAATTTATLDTPGRPVLPDGGTLPRLAHAEKNLKRRAAESPTSRSACFLVSRTVLTHP